MAHKTIAQMFEDVVNAYHSFDTAAQIYDRECHTPRFRAIFLSNLIDTTSANTKLFNECIKGITFFQNEIDYPINRVPRPCMV